MSYHKLVVCMCAFRVISTNTHFSKLKLNSPLTWLTVSATVRERKKEGNGMRREY